MTHIDIDVKDIPFGEEIQLPFKEVTEIKPLVHTVRIYGILKAEYACWGNEGAWTDICCKCKWRTECAEEAER